MTLKKMDSTEEQNRWIFDAAPVKVFISGFNTRMNYPYIMRDVNHPSPKMSRKSDEYILDSSIGDDDVDNEKVREIADHVDADVVVPKDFIGEPERALDSAQEMFDNSDYEVIVPIQSNDKGRRYWAERAYERFGSDPWAYAVGGVKDKAPRYQIGAARRVREAVGVKEDVHMFGGGMSPVWITAIRNAPDLIDTLDVATPVNAAMKGHLVYADASEHGTGNLRGKHSTVRAARLAELSTINFCYMISDLIRPEDAEDALK